jgi:hypothetical protein
MPGPSIGGWRSLMADEVETTGGAAEQTRTELVDRCARGETFDLAVRKMDR